MDLEQGDDVSIVVAMGEMNQRHGKRQIDAILKCI